MAAKSKGHSDLSADQLRGLFAKGILRHGKASKRNPRGKVIFDKKRDKEVKHMQGKGDAGFTYRQKGSTHIGPNSSKNFASKANHSNTGKGNAYGNGRFVIGGSEAAGLRGTGLGGKPKVDHSATRAERLVRANMKLNSQKQSGVLGPNGRVSRQFAELRKQAGPVFDSLSTRQKNKLRVEKYRPAGRTRDRGSNTGRIGNALNKVRADQREVYAPTKGMSRSEERRFTSDPNVKKRYRTLKLREERILKIKSRLTTL